MTDKEQIIIDGIQFNEFGDFYVDYDLNGKFQSISSSTKEYKILKSLIKQLTRKTQECEKYEKRAVCFKDVNKQLGYKYLTIKQECEELKERLVRTEEDLKYQCVDCMNVKSDRYRKALEKIENLMQTVSDADECSYGDFDCRNCDSDNSCPTKVKRLILDIIDKNKAKKGE